MKERIIEFLRKENKSSVHLAHEIGVQPSSISHILSGRNKPSLDFVLKMLSRYKNLSTEWLLFGRGEMYSAASEPTLFNNNILEAGADTVENSEVGTKTGGIIRENPELMALNDSSAVKQINRKAIRIVIFHDDNTFSEYYPV